MSTQGLYPIGPNRNEQSRVRDDLTAAYGQTADAAEVQRTASKAHSWRYDAELEQLAALRDTDPAAFSTMPPTSKVSLGLYLEGKRCAAAVGFNTTEPKG